MSRYRYTPERIADLRDACDLNRGIGVGQFVVWLEEALDEIERLQDRQSRCERFDAH